ncbi:hypothetical protein Pla22_13370 [Rubripirellula amarantea]|uniref:YHS domain protein n=1 Tax=Rubripirellula amarantea TaxID=2527999 RepID=A0A5C5WUL0_9BACT|nr:hypothetical protein [Rubripirellula amarantea]TWT53705.1 hypothetical protein Pla22_13370 [Rubripirellula amarantea]
MKRFALSGLAVILVAAATVIAGEVELEGVKCVVAPKPATEGKSADYKEGKVYFCCGGCAGKFASNPDKFAVNANQQLVATKQYEQKACPMSGGDVNPEITSTVAGTKVAFCCNGCKSKVDSAEDEASALKIVFNDKAFKKAFAKAEAK